MKSELEVERMPPAIRRLHGVAPKEPAAVQAADVVDQVCVFLTCIFTCAGFFCLSVITLRFAVLRGLISSLIEYRER